MNNTDRFNRYLQALNQYIAREHHTAVPSKHIEYLSFPDDVEIKLGDWVGYVRARYRAGLLPLDRIEALNATPHWTWAKRRPGPTPHPDRDRTIVRQRQTGASLADIANSHGLTRQRIHQILLEDETTIDA